MGQDLSEADVAAFMKTCDKDGDGVITYEGFQYLELNKLKCCFEYR